MGGRIYLSSWVTKKTPSELFTYLKIIQTIFYNYLDC